MVLDILLIISMVLFILTIMVYFILKHYLMMMCMVVDNLGNSVLHIDMSNGLDKACLWHCQQETHFPTPKYGVLESFDLRSDDTYKSCLQGKITKSPFTGSCEKR